MHELRWLNEHHSEEPFPAPHEALDDPNGLLAVGGDLTPRRLISAYRQGIFPWYAPGQPILWWSPDPRGLFMPGDFHISRSLRRRINSGRYRVTFDTAFDAVVVGCAQPRAEQDGTWITHEMMAAYTELFYRGCAHSVEVWRGDELIGGVYGVALHGAFFGESMFSRAADASKVALAWLTAQLWAWGFHFLDCQMDNPHLRRLGVREIRRDDYLAKLSRALQVPHHPLPWHFDHDLDPLRQNGCCRRRSFSV